MPVLQSSYEKLRKMFQNKRLNHDTVFRHVTNSKSRIIAKNPKLASYHQSTEDLENLNKTDTKLFKIYRKKKCFGHVKHI